VTRDARPAFGPARRSPIDLCDAHSPNAAFCDGQLRFGEGRMAIETAMLRTGVIGVSAGESQRALVLTRLTLIAARTADSMVGGRE